MSVYSQNKMSSSRTNMSCPKSKSSQEKWPANTAKFNDNKPKGPVLLVRNNYRVQVQGLELTMTKMRNKRLSGKDILLTSKKISVRSYKLKLIALSNKTRKCCPSRPSMILSMACTNSLIRSRTGRHSETDFLISWTTCPSDCC